MLARSRLLQLVSMAALTTFLAACATTREPDIRVHSAPNAAFESYGTFGFPEQSGTDRGGYSTLVTNYFKKAVREQMESRGYRFVDENPALLVNFYANVRERTEVHSRPSTGYGYYGYRYGLYSPWPMYEQDVDTVTYPIGTANIDIVDAKRKQMIWEAVAQGRIHDEDMEQPEGAIARVVGQMFEKFPGRASAVDNAANQTHATER